MRKLILLSFALIIISKISNAQTGELDSSFAVDGIAISASGSGDTYYTSLAVQKDGKLVVAGSTSLDGNSDVAVARYNKDGNLDSTFSADGIQVTAFSLSNDAAKAVSIQTNGKIVAAGYAYSDSNFVFAIARYNI